MKSLLIIALLIAFASCAAEVEWTNSKHNNKGANWPIFFGIIGTIVTLEVLGFASEMCYKKGLTNHIKIQDLAHTDGTENHF